MKKGSKNEVTFEKFWTHFEVLLNYTVGFTLIQSPEFMIFAFHDYLAFSTKNHKIRGPPVSFRFDIVSA